MEKAKITFMDGTVINADVNGTCFIVDEEPEFPADLSTVKIEDGNEEKELHNGQIIECAGTDDRYWFSIVEISATELEKEKTDAQIMYTALMTDTLLEEE